MNVQLSRNFNSKEFDSPDHIDSGLKISQDLVNMLQKVRDIVQRPMIVTSGVRSMAHNTKVGGLINSSHLTGLAADVKCNNSLERYDLCIAAFIVGFRRIELAENHIHFDIDESKSQDVLFLGDSH